MAPLSYRKMDLEEFCTAAISTYQLEALEGWEQIASTAFEHFEWESNRIISVEELARVITSEAWNNIFLVLLWFIFRSVLKKVLAIDSIGAGTECWPNIIYNSHRLDSSI